MHEAIDDFEPDFDSYYRMDDEERQVRKDLYRIWMKYSNGKITYETYLTEIDNPYFYGVLSDVEWKQIKEIHEKEKYKKQANALKGTIDQKLKEKQKVLIKLITLIFFIILILFALSK